MAVAYTHRLLLIRLTHATLPASNDECLCQKAARTSKLLLHSSFQVLIKYLQTDRLPQQSGSSCPGTYQPTKTSCRTPSSANKRTKINIQTAVCVRVPHQLLSQYNHISSLTIDLFPSIPHCNRTTKRNTPTPLLKLPLIKHNISIRPIHSSYHASIRHPPIPIPLPSQHMAPECTPSSLLPPHVLPSHDATDPLACHHSQSIKPCHTPPITPRHHSTYTPIPRRPTSNHNRTGALPFQC
ncbi:hypothetical protein M758_8G064800, partial [Ceratodon purpureus]